MYILHIVLLVISITWIHSSIYPSNVLSYLKKERNPKRDQLKFATGNNKHEIFNSDKNDEIEAKIERNDMDGIEHDTKRNIERNVKRSRKKSLLDLVKRRYNDYNSSVSSSGSSSSFEQKKWKDEWREHWLQKKFEAINTSAPAGDTVNMIAARPWGVSCGDPNQHDAPWGTCMLPMECEPEYRIFRGDYFCGRTKFVCCALQMNTYDMYQGFDVSFADSSFETDTEEKRNRDRGSKERKRHRKHRQRKRRRRDRLKRKRKIKRKIRRIVREIRKILNRSYKNGTTERRKKTKQLKKFIKMLKKKYRSDRLSVKDIHEMEMLKVDAALMKKLNEIRIMNEHFMKNSTFRSIIVNGTISKKDARMLVEAYPDLADMLDLESRRTGIKRIKPKDYLDYDIEYGYLYY